MHTEKHEEQKMVKFKKMAYQMAMMSAAQMGGGGGQRPGGQQKSGGSPGIAAPKTQIQQADLSLEQATTNEFPGAPTPGG